MYGPFLVLAGKMLGLFPGIETVQSASNRPLARARFTLPTACACKFAIACAWNGNENLEREVFEARLWSLYTPWVLHNEVARACKFACMDRGLGMGIYIALRTLKSSVVGGACCSSKYIITICYGYNDNYQTTIIGVTI